MNKVNKSIGWSDYSLNLITGCLNHTNGLCKGGNFPCYAYKLAHGRLKERYLANQNLSSDYPEMLMAFKTREPFDDPFYPRLWPERFTVKGIPKGSRIFLNDMSDWVGIGIPEEWTLKVLDFIRANPDHTFLTLTKQPQNLPKFSSFPDNCWVGVTATDTYMAVKGLQCLDKIKAKEKFMSFEPLLSQTCMTETSLLSLNWLIIGSCTGTYQGMAELQKKYPELTLMPYGKKWTLQPQIEGVREIVSAADKAGIKVFLKDNLRPLIVQVKEGSEYAPLWANGGYGTLRQEFLR